MSEATTHRQLPDGTDVVVRAVRPEDRALLLRGFEQFGEESRYRRFHMHKNALSEEDLRYLTEVDGVQHQALGAVAHDAKGRELPLGIARYVRAESDAEVAEAAVAVVDTMQGKGVGKVLLHALSDAAYAQGVRKFRCSVLAANEPIHKVLLELDPQARVVRTGSTVEELELELPVPDASDTDAPSGPRKRLEQLLRLTAQRLSGRR